MADFNDFSVMGASTLNEINSLFRGKNRTLAQEMLKLVNDFRPYWPMTLRGLYYQAVSALLIKNNQASYKAMGVMLAKLRRAEILPWKAMEDKTRSTQGKRGVPDVSHFIQEQLETFMDSRYYGRCYVQNQENYVEVTVEKDALSTLVKKAAYMYCTRVTVTKGQISATFLEKLAGRFDDAIMKGQNPILLHFGDLDATGVQIPLSLQNGMAEHHYVEVDVRQPALTPAQVVEHDLPQDELSAVKVDDPNYERWLERFPNQAPTELDALHPEKLKQLVKDSLEDVYDMSDVEHQKRVEAEEDEILDEMRESTLDHFIETYPEVMKKAGYA